MSSCTTFLKNMNVIFNLIFIACAGSEVVTILTTCIPYMVTQTYCQIQKVTVVRS